MSYSFSPTLPIDGLVREENSDLQAYTVREFSVNGCRHLIGFRPQRQELETLRQMDTEEHHHIVRSNAFRDAVKAGLVTWTPSTCLEGSRPPNGIFYWPLDDDDGLNPGMKNSPNLGAGPVKPPVKNPDQPRTPITSQSNQQSKKKASLTDKIITLIISGHHTPDTIKRHLTKTEQISDSLIQRLIKLVLDLPESQRVDLHTTKNSLAENMEFRRIKKQIEDELNGPEMN